jgi:hypothetical protein
VISTGRRAAGLQHIFGEYIRKARVNTGPDMVELCDECVFQPIDANLAHDYKQDGLY